VIGSYIDPWIPFTIYTGWEAIPDIFAATFTAWPYLSELKASEMRNATYITELCCRDQVQAQDMPKSLFILVPKLVDKEIQPKAYKRSL
jgi:hypothetical protein